MGVFAELKRRNVFRVAAAYAVVSWLMLQIVAVITPFVVLPSWFGGFVLVLLVIGFPVACVLAWAYELTPGGFKKTVEVPREDSIRPQTGRKLDRIIIAVLALVVIVLLVDRFLGPTPPQMPAPAETLSSEYSVAVLPFVDLSPGGDQGYFSDGISEEIINVLVKMPDLRVVGRTSAFQFKGENKDLRAIGESLNASHIIEGSVRKAGAQVRITAQLIKADDGFHLWSNTYDRKLDLANLFAIQDEIARAIMDALEVPLGVDMDITRAPTDDLEAYEDYLRARALFRQRKVVEATELLEGLVARRPDFALAWALLAQVHTVYSAFLAARESLDFDTLVQFVGRSLAIVKDAAARAAALDPDNVEVLTAVAASQRNFATLMEAEDTYLKALKLDPTHPELLEDYSQFLRMVGKMREGLTIVKRLVESEPSEPYYQNYLGAALYAAGDLEGAIVLYESGAVPLDYTWLTTAHVVFTYFQAGRYNDARKTLAFYKPGLIRPSQLQNLDQVLAALAAGEVPPEVDTTEVPGGLIINLWPQLGESPAYLDAWSRLLLDAGWRDMAMNLSYPIVSPARKTQQYKQLVTEIGLVDYWRERGWADFCHPVGEDDFECE